MQESMSQSLHAATVEPQLLSHYEFELALTPFLDQSESESGTPLPGVLVCLELLFFDVMYRLGGIETVNRMHTHFTQSLVDILGEEVILGRLSNNSVGLMVPGATVPQVKQQLAQLEHRCSDIRASSIDGDIQLNFVAGLTVVNGMTWDPSELVFEALSACQVAENLGPFALHTFEPAESDEADFQRVVMWIPRLQEAVDGQTMTLHQQPIVPIQPGSDLQALREFLVRVPDDVGRPVDAASFIDIAEKYRFVGRIDRWVFRKVISHLKAGLGTEVRSFVNLSAHSLQDPTFLDFVRDLITDSQIDGQCLGFEVTECSLIRDVETAAIFLRAVRDLGCTVALDDFGTGYSSLQHLSQLPVDIIKLDGQFVSDLPHDVVSMAITEAAVRFARATGKLIVAECVEREDTLECIRHLGIDYAQGYALGRPSATE